MRQWMLKNNFSSGEVSPLLWTRTDVQQYGNGAKRLLNVLPLVEGGVKKRPGTRYKRTLEGAIRLIPFIANSEQPFLLILKPSTMWIYDPRIDQIVDEIATPYDTVQKINEVQYAHTRYRMYFVQGDTPVYRLLSSQTFDQWQFSPFNFSVAPTDEIGATPNVALKPSGTEVGKDINLTASVFPTWNEDESYIAGERVIYMGLFYRALVDNKGVMPAIVSSAIWESIGSESAAVFEPEHIGCIVNINGGQVKIKSITSSSVAVGEVLVKLKSDIEAITKSWSLDSLAFSEVSGYPRTVVFFKQRLVFANTKTSPNQLWFSAIGNDAEFLETTEDADAFSIASSSAQSDNILHLAQRGGVVALTGGSEFLVSSSGAMTPASAQIEQHTSYGAQKDVRPCMVGNDMLFVQRGGERLRALTYRYEVDGLVSPELSAIAPHITHEHGGINEMTYQQAPNSVVWLVLNDGKVASITLNRDQEMNAWSLHDFGGYIVSMCSLPTIVGDDRCFMLCKRGAHTFLEELSSSALSDCEIPYRAANPSAVVETLINPHINWRDESGYFYHDDPSDFKYIADREQYYGQPFEVLIDLLPPDYSQVPSTAMFHKISLHEVVLYVSNSIGGFVNGYEINHKQINPFAFQNLPNTGYVEIQQQGWSKLCDLQLKITHNKPLPFHVQSVSMMVSINEK